MSDPADDPNERECYLWTPLCSGGEIDCEASRYTKEDAIVAHSESWMHDNPIVAWLKYLNGGLYEVEGAK